MKNKFNKEKDPGSATLVKKFILNLALIFAFVSLAQADDVKIIKISHQGMADPEVNIQSYFVTEFVNRVEARTDGKIKFEVYPDEQLGTEEQRLELIMRSGLNQPVIDMSSFAALGTVLPELYASAVPFMFNSFEAAHIFFDTSDYMRELKEFFRQRTGCVMLEVVEEGGFLAFTNSKRELKSPKDFKGLKFRAMDEGQIAIFNAFGASGTPIPWSEVYMALKTGVADGQMNPAFYILLGSLPEVQKYMTLANIQYSDQFFVINEDLFNSLSDEERKIIREAASEANKLTRERIEAQDLEQIEECRKRGMNVYAPNLDEMNEFRTIGQPNYVEWLKTRLDDAKWLDMALREAEAANNLAK
ncbi:MAG: TRAP transporter substrate-binding protein DctP [Synergistaceae bacterium]|nr:TRAP transporter substrate-binding protein DctP [Synergistaceae bacterium]